MWVGTTFADCCEKTVHEAEKKAAADCRTSQAADQEAVTDVVLVKAFATFHDADQEACTVATPGAAAVDQEAAQVFVARAITFQEAVQVFVTETASVPAAGA